MSDGHWHRYGFTWKNRYWRVSDLRVFRPRGARYVCRHVIMATQDDSRVFVGALGASEDGHFVHEADAVEIEALIDLYQLDELRPALAILVTNKHVGPAVPDMP